MAVDPNITNFLELVVNNRDFRAAISTQDPEKIKAAFKSAEGFTDLSEEEIDAAANALATVKPMQNLSNLQASLSHLDPRILGN